MPNITFSRLLDESTLGAYGTTENDVAAGVRWDFAKNMDLKFQMDHITRQSPRPFFGYTGSFNVIQAGAGSFITNNKAVDVLTVALDFVF